MTESPAARSHSSMGLTSPPIMLAVIVLVSLLSVVDRNVLSVVLDPVRRSVGISDFEAGYLLGPGFIVFSVAGNLVGGRFADRADRLTIMVVALLIWSVATSATGLVQGLVWLAVARAVVGFSEGMIAPSFHSLIADRFSPQALPLALGVYSIGSAVGPGVAVLVVGVLVGFAPAIAAALGVPWLETWRMAFLLIGLPGAMLALLIWWRLRLPPLVHFTDDHDSSQPDFGGFVTARRSFLLRYISGIGLLFASEAAFFAWLPTLIHRRFGLEGAQLAAVLGPSMIVAGVAGSLLWGAVTSRAIAGGRPHSALIIMVITMAVVTPMVAIVPLMPTAVWVAVVTVPVILLRTSYGPLGHAALQAMAHSGLRGRVAGTYLACVSIIGSFLGPMLIGALSTFFFHDDHSLGLGLALVGGVTSGVGTLLLWSSLRPYRLALV